MIWGKKLCSDAYLCCVKAKSCEFKGVGPMDQINVLLKALSLLRHCSCQKQCFVCYCTRGADKSLAQPGRKQATVTEL